MPQIEIGISTKIKRDKTFLSNRNLLVLDLLALICLWAAIGITFSTKVLATNQDIIISAKATKKTWE